MASPVKENNYRMKSYKNKALNPEEMRRRREEEGIQLRKQKREQQVTLAWVMGGWRDAQVHVRQGKGRKGRQLS